jgi:hypothetical protein
MNFRNAFAASAVLLAVAVSAPASADTFSLTTNGGDGSVIDPAPNGFPNGFDLIGSNNGLSFVVTTYTATALSNQIFNVNWVYQTDDDDPSFDPAGYVINGFRIQLTDDFGPNDQSGSFILSVLTNDIYGFYVDSTDGIGGRADILVTTTAAETPLPAALPLFATGLGALGLLGWRRKRKAQAAA